MANENTNLLQSTQNVRKYTLIVMWGMIFFLALKLIGGIINLFIFAKYDNDMFIDYILIVDEVKVAIIGLFSMPWLVLWIVFMILYSGWIHRSYTNLVKQHVQGLQMTPAWAVGWNFMPLLHFFKPYMVMKEIWKATFYAGTDSEEWKQQSVPSYFIWWWVFFIIGSITLFNWFQLGQTFFSLKMGKWLVVVSAISYITSGMILLKIMKQITAKQVERFKEEA